MDRNDALSTCETFAVRLRNTRIERGLSQQDKLYIFKKKRFIDGGMTSNVYLINHPSVTMDWRVEEG